MQEHLKNPFHHSEFVVDPQRNALRFVKTLQKLQLFLLHLFFPLIFLIYLYSYNYSWEILLTGKFCIFISCHWCLMPLCLVLHSYSIFYSIESENAKGECSGIVYMKEKLGLFNLYCCSKKAIPERLLYNPLFHLEQNDLFCKKLILLESKGFWWTKDEDISQA